MTDIKWDTFPAVLDQIVDEFGEDFVYEPPSAGLADDSLYRHDGKPSCLIGHVLDRLGVAYDKEWEWCPALTVVSELGAPIEIARAADSAQGIQDALHTWGDARQEFHQVLDWERAS